MVVGNLKKNSVRINESIVEVRFKADIYRPTQANQTRLHSGIVGLKKQQNETKSIPVSIPVTEMKKEYIIGASK